MNLLRRREIILLIMPVILLLFLPGDWFLDKRSLHRPSPQRIEILAAKVQLDSLVRRLSEQELEYILLLTKTQINDSLLQRLPVSELSLIVVCYSQEPDGIKVIDDQIIAPRCYLETLLQSLIKLHGPGGRGKPAEMIKVGEPHLDGPWWWTHPSVNIRGAIQGGALVISWHNFKIVWHRPYNSLSQGRDT